MKIKKYASRTLPVVFIFFSIRGRLGLIENLAFELFSSLLSSILEHSFSTSNLKLTQITNTTMLQKKSPLFSERRAVFPL